MMQRYEILYADPPWPERGAGKIHRGADRHYPLMTVEAIEGMRHELPDGKPGVLQLAADDGFLFLWANNGFLPQALNVMDAWGFRYATNIVWDKSPQVGLGFYTRGQHELLLIGVRGRPAYSRQPHGGTRAGRNTPLSVIHAQRTEHSRKPAAAYRVIERFGAGPRLELFRPQAAGGLGCVGQRNPGGRERMSTDRKTTDIRIRLTEEEKADFQRVADFNDMTLSDLIRRFCGLPWNRREPAKRSGMVNPNGEETLVNDADEPLEVF